MNRKYCLPCVCALVAIGSYIAVHWIILQVLQ